MILERGGGVIKVHLHMGMQRKRTQQRPRHLLHLYHRGPRISAGIILHQQSPQHVQSDNIQLDDTTGDVSYFGTLYPDKDCILFLVGLLPGEGFHHILMYSLLAVSS